MEQRQHLKIMGSSCAEGGTYDKVSILGDGEVNGNVECRLFTCAGTARVHGHVKSEEMKIRGTSHMEGSLLARKLAVQGQSDFTDSVKAQEANISGMVNIGGSLQGERLKLRGSVEVQGDCEIETISAVGSFAVHGLLNVGSLDLRINWHCQAKEIGGESIMVRKGGGLTNMLKFIPGIFQAMPDARLTSDIIEGDHIELEHTTAGIVRGNHVKIGPGCEIGRVEYRHHFDQAQDSAVNSVVQM
ncbi:bactofilin family protein [Paenibacillus apiarius]|uniref:Polymer-forming cytoskeletal protein n=1 Tax=Paenibacillus apiarius TaxID=46240 RepID=A0ABT4DNS1_9BACL|nr:polymer-forming cytoskeletal protein [Paenibacillus apiarius]MCY9512844.1 polymer-forming cytoskeletal protein [Paenibacillus apiarius]MCY9519012.1 polymer-forming cytoskeletal protein [Paenibacillus apiarius]MCY9550821.1 polymer-forming cytoskeletal protein [Paenibacillus apiarius]MCY9559745.1 polymer-forming cytoskeletal protein [Paenibacillus apiarius]MCY9681988.1 polymer-forming cytoskeletal protein [Paenibacillus apiarius]